MQVEASLGEGRATWGDSMKVCYAACVAALLSSTAVAQTATAPAAAVAIAPASTEILRTGTAIQLKMEEPLTTEGKKLRVGQHFQLSVVEPVKVGDQIVIPVGSPATGEITEVRNKGMWGKSGHLTANLLYVSVNGRQIRLTGTFDDKGVTGTGGVVAAVLLVPVVGFFTTGTSAKIDAGAQVKGFIGEDVPLVFAEATPAPAPMVVPAAAPAAPASQASTPVATAKPIAAKSLVDPSLEIKAQ